MDTNEQSLVTAQKNKSNSGCFLFIVIMLIATLPFHYVTASFMVFPKENLTFSNTFIIPDDIDKLIERYNNASLYEKQLINQEPLVRKLKEKGLIVVKKESINNVDDY